MYIGKAFYVLDESNDDNLTATREGDDSKLSEVELSRHRYSEVILEEFLPPKEVHPPRSRPLINPHPVVNVPYIQ